MAEEERIEQEYQRERALLIAEAEAQAQQVLNSATKIQCMWRGGKTRKLLAEEEEKGWAALTIQAIWRGGKYRSDDDKEHNRRVQACQQIQKVWRGGKVRADFDAVHAGNSEDEVEDDFDIRDSDSDEDREEARLEQKYRQRELKRDDGQSSMTYVPNAPKDRSGARRDMDSIYLLRHKRKDMFAQGRMLKQGGSKFKKKWEERVFVINTVGLGW